MLKRRTLGIAVGVGLLILGLLWLVYEDAQARYVELESVYTLDRHGAVIAVTPNAKDHYTLPNTPLPESFTQLLLKKEDRYFYYHPGINPVSTVRGLYNLARGNGGGGSTITQQLAKNLLSTESERTLSNKVLELLYAIALEVFLSKDTILEWYTSTMYLGNQLQGVAAASQAYYGMSPAELTTDQQLALLATISHPTTRNPWTTANETKAKMLAANLLPEHTFSSPEVARAYQLQTATRFELDSYDINCPATCQLTIDHEVTEAIRDIVKRHTETTWQQNGRNAAVVVLDPKTGELLTLVGSVDPSSSTAGNQINMAVEPRPVGSTIKPFIYTLAFEEGLRPYTLVDDREYKYSIQTGFSLYPKNYDGQYRGEVTLHESLSNSLNVPTVKTLEYIGLTPFYDFMSSRLHFTPLQPYDSYQYGIALGGLEMDLLTLTHYFSVFANGGVLEPVQVYQDSSLPLALPQSIITRNTPVFSPEHVALTHAILSDRLRGVNQFGLVGNLHVSASDYGVKTGTSRDWHDSWVVGYTPDFVVGVWLGNSENEAMNQLSGQSGAGAIWHDVMEYLIASPYYTDTSFDYPVLTAYEINQSTEWGLADDQVEDLRYRLLEDNLIITPLSGDVFGLFSGLKIPLETTEPVTWMHNNEVVGYGTLVDFTPTQIGQYKLTASTETGEQDSITIEVTEVTSQ